MELLQDPLDTEDFDPVDFINQRFPTGNHFSHISILIESDLCLIVSSFVESSLDDLDSFVNDITSQISSLDAVCILLYSDYNLKYLI